MTRAGEIVLQSESRIVVRGHFDAEEMRRLTGWSGDIRRTWWRHAYTTPRQCLLIAVPRGRFVESRKGPGRGAFPVTILNIRREPNAA